MTQLTDGDPTGESIKKVSLHEALYARLTAPERLSTAIIQSRNNLYAHLVDSILTFGASEDPAKLTKVLNDTKDRINEIGKATGFNIDEARRSMSRDEFIKNLIPLYKRVVPYGTNLYCLRANRPTVLEYTRIVLELVAERKGTFYLPELYNVIQMNSADKFGSNVILGTHADAFSEEGQAKLLKDVKFTDSLKPGFWQAYYLPLLLTICLPYGVYKGKEESIVEATRELKRNITKDRYAQLLTLATDKQVIADLQQLGLLGVEDKRQYVNNIALLFKEMVVGNAITLDKIVNFDFTKLNAKTLNKAGGRSKEQEESSEADENSESSEKVDQKRAGQIVLGEDSRTATMDPEFLPFLCDLYEEVLLDLPARIKLGDIVTYDGLKAYCTDAVRLIRKGRADPDSTDSLKDLLREHYGVINNLFQYYELNPKLLLISNKKWRGYEQLPNLYQKHFQLREQALK
ncbi:MAG: hypothetical protein WCO33_01510 [bacterium]